MSDNLPWLFGACTLGWLILFGYLVWLAKRERELRRRVAALQEGFMRRSAESSSARLRQT